MFSPPSSSSLALSVASTPHQERRHADLDQEQLQTSRAAFTQYQSPRRTPATSLILRSLTPSNNFRALVLSSQRQRALADGSPPLDVRFDLLVSLPVEVSIIILEFLQPKDLCQVCQVSQSWYRLSQHPSLLKRRKRYVKARREEYQTSKENFPPSSLRDNGTPQQTVTYASLRHMTTGLSPLNVIQLKSSDRNTNHRTNAMPSPTQTSGQTPCPAYLLETVQRLSLEDNTAEVRRCLFPIADSTPPHHTHRNMPARPAWGQRNNYKCCTKGELIMAGKKTNRSRLRRL